MSSLLVEFVPGLTIAQQADVIARNGGAETSAIPALRLHVVAVPTDSVAAVMASYQADPQVQHVELNTKRQSEAIPADALYSYQRPLPKIGFDEVYGVGASTQPPATPSAHIPSRLAGDGDGLARHLGEHHLLGGLTSVSAYKAGR